MELEITHMIDDDMHLLSGSVMELGDNAGQLTWNNSLKYGDENPLLRTPEAIEYAKKYLGEFGAWDDEERAAWSAREVEALIIQLIAGDIREMEAFDTWEEYQSASERGSVSGNIFRVFSELDRKINYYYYLGN